MKKLLEQSIKTIDDRIKFYKNKLQQLKNNEINNNATIRKLDKNSLLDEIRYLQNTKDNFTKILKILQKLNFDGNIVQIDDVELFVQINCLTCQYGVITPETCIKNRLKYSSKYIVIPEKIQLYDKSVNIRSICCDKCNHYTDLIIDIINKRYEYSNS